MSKKRKKDDNNILKENVGQYWNRLLESGENADILLCVKGENGDEILKVRKRRKLFKVLTQNK